MSFTPSIALRSKGGLSLVAHATERVLLALLPIEHGVESDLLVVIGTDHSLEVRAEFD